MKPAATARRRHVSDEILRQAGELFDERGYGECSLQDIADAVGIARPSLYHYFESKEEILANLVERTSEIREAIIARIEAMESGPLERLRALIREVGTSTSSNPASLRLTLDASGALPDEVRRRDVKSRRILFELLTDILADGMDRGVFRTTNERETAAILIAAITGLQYREIGGVRLESESAVGLLEDVLIEGIRQPSSQRAANLDEALARVHEDLAVLERHARREAARRDDRD